MSKLTDNITRESLRLLANTFTNEALINRSILEDLLVVDRLRQSVKEIQGFRYQEPEKKFIKIRIPLTKPPADW